MEEVRLEVAVKLRQCIEQLGGKAVDLFQIIAKGEDVASVEEDPRGKNDGRGPGGDGDEWDDDWDARRWLFGMLGMACSERFGKVRKGSVCSFSIHLGK